MRIFSSKTFLAMVILLSGFGFSGSVFAANISLDPLSPNASVGGEVFIDVMLNPENASINAVQGSVAIPAGFSFVGSDDSKSFIGMWIERPKFSPEKNSVEFSGIIPGGFTGLIDPFSPNLKKPGNVVRLILTPTVEGVGTLAVTDARAYFNDGEGSEAPVTVTGTTITVSGYGTVAQKIDRELPLPFTASIERDPLLFDNQYTLIFSTKDFGSGIDHYEIQERGGAWIIGESPYLLKDQNLSGPIKVKAVDRAGNERIVSVPFPSLQSAQKQSAIAWAVIAGFSILLIILLWLKKKFFKNDEVNNENNKMYEN